MGLRRCRGDRAWRSTCRPRPATAVALGGVVAEGDADVLARRCPAPDRDVVRMRWSTAWSENSGDSETSARAAWAAHREVRTASAARKGNTGEHKIDAVAVEGKQARRLTMRGSVGSRCFRVKERSRSLARRERAGGCMVLPMFSHCSMPCWVPSPPTPSPCRSIGTTTAPRSRGTTAGSQAYLAPKNPHSRQHPVAFELHPTQRTRRHSPRPGAFLGPARRALPPVPCARARTRSTSSSPPVSTPRSPNSAVTTPTPAGVLH